ncbi:tripartite tricarboxylate transporter TctB family protein [Glutamicibacter sp. MNS18]|uniref:tripartite tricarboxylate transporter TctB family protein n=1 Tax=Glutamicibacter sp. MNS18 TaxID=2989817 RepID=UPI00223602CC|nr:tripartite tricarboxylate transporter TctB family protein [Glutamicibacter sp. MNS18]MCW4465615.1 tripartite tricarboxylate transporter TctB family protein [Glutamicibacter sp. MNS18]
MTTPTTQPESPAPRLPQQSTHQAQGFWAGRSELVVPALVLALAVFLTYQTATMQVLGSSVPGPQSFPTIVCVLLYAMVLIHTIQILRHPRLPDPTDDSGNPDFSSDMLGDLADATERGRSKIEGRTPDAKLPAGWKAYSDWKTVGMVIAGVAGFTLLLPYAGWILSASALFWIVSRALGSKRAVFDISISVLFASVIQLAFNAGLGLNLPSGFLEGLL